MARVYPAPTSYMGTGDIEDPREKVNIDPQGEQIRLIQGRDESYQSFLDRATESSNKKREYLAEQLALGKLRTPSQIEKAAIKLGCLPREIERQKWSRSMEKRVAELFQRAALYATAATLPAQERRAEEDTASWVALAKAGLGALKSGPLVQQNTVNVDQRNGGDNDADRRFFENFQKRAQSGALRLVDGARVLDPKDDPPEPDEEPLPEAASAEGCVGGSNPDQPPDSSGAADET